MKKFVIIAALSMLMSPLAVYAQEASSSKLEGVTKQTAASIHEVVEDLSKKAILWLEAQERHLQRDLNALDVEDSQKVNPDARNKLNEAANVEVSTSVSRGPSVSSAFERLWKNFALLAVKLAIYILQHPWLLYTVLGLILLRIIFTIFRFFFRSSD